MKENKEKLRELILYICERCADDPYFGATKLNKALFLADFFAYGELGKPITGTEYQKLSYGPAPRRLVPVRQEMEDRGELAVQEVRLSNLATQKRSVNLRPPNLSVFSPQEVAIIGTVLEKLRGATADSVSRYTHRWAGWRVADNGETIPYTTVFISDDPITDLEILRGKELARNQGWNI